jgi:hypothetical protein
VNNKRTLGKIVETFDQKVELDLSKLTRATMRRFLISLGKNREKSYSAREPVRLGHGKGDAEEEVFDKAGGEFPSGY